MIRLSVCWVFVLCHTYDSCILKRFIVEIMWHRFSLKFMEKCTLCGSGIYQIIIIIIYSIYIALYNALL